MISRNIKNLLFLLLFLPSIASAQFTGPTLPPTSGGSGSGDVTGPGSSLNNEIVLFDGTAGDAIQGSGILVTGGVMELGSIGINSTDTIDASTLHGNVIEVDTRVEFTDDLDGATVATEPAIFLDLDGSLQFNNTTGDVVRTSINDVSQLEISDTVANFFDNSITTTGVLTIGGFSVRNTANTADVITIDPTDPSTGTGNKYALQVYPNGNSVEITGSANPISSIFSFASINAGTQSAFYRGIVSQLRLTGSAVTTGTGGNSPRVGHFAIVHDSTGAQAELAGFQNNIQILATGSTVTTGTVTNIFGQKNQITYGTGTGTGAVTTGTLSLFQTPANTSGTKTIGTLLGIDIQDLHPTGVTNSTAINIQNQTTGGNAIITGTGPVSFGDNVNIVCANTTTGFCLNSNDANALTTGAIARFVSNSADASGRNLVFIRNQNSAANQTTPLTIQQDAANQAMVINQNTNSHGLVINTPSALGNNALRFATTGQTTGAIISIPAADSLTTGNALNFVSNSADASTRSLTFIRNQNAGAVNATILQLQQDANAPTLVINSSATTKSALSFAATSQTTGTIIAVNSANSLTTGGIAAFLSNSADATARNLFFIRNQNAGATGANLIGLQQDANASTMTFNSSATSQSVLSFNTTGQTTGTIININAANSLTTGGILNLSSNSADNGSRNLVNIQNQNTGATGTTVLSITQGAARQAVNINQNGNGQAISVNAAGVTNQAVIQINGANALTTGTLINGNSNSADTSFRNLVFFQNQNALAVNATVLSVQQDAAGTGVNLSQNGNGTALNINASGVTTGSVINTIGDALTTGSLAAFSSNSASSSSRNLVNINNANASATGAVALFVGQQSTNMAVNVNRGAVNSTNNAVTIVDQGTGTGATLNISKQGGSYQNGNGYVQFGRSGNFTGVAGESTNDLSISPTYTLTAPGTAGVFTYSGVNINMSSLGATAGTGSLGVAGLTINAATDADIATSLAISATGDSVFKGRILGSKANDIAAAATITVTGGNAITLTGNTNVDFITTTNWTSGSFLLLQFTGTPTINNNTGGAPGGTANIQLSGSAAFGATANDTLLLYYDGGSWREVARTVI